MRDELNLYQEVKNAVRNTDLSRIVTQDFPADVLKIAFEFPLDKDREFVRKKPAVQSILETEGWEFEYNISDKKRNKYLGETETMTPEELIAYLLKQYKDKQILVTYAFEMGQGPRIIPDEIGVYTKNIS